MTTAIMALKREDWESYRLNEAGERRARVRLVGVWEGEPGRNILQLIIISSLCVNSNKSIKS